MALAIVLMVLTVFSVLGISLLSTTINNANLSSIERDTQSAYYIAEAGANYKLNEIRNAVLDAYQSPTGVELDELLEPVELNTFEEVFGEQPIVQVRVETINDMDNPQVYRVISEGVIGDRSRTVETSFMLTAQESGSSIEIPDVALFTQGAINLKGGSTIDGDVSTNSNNVNTKGGAGITGDITRNLNKTYEIPPFPEIPNYNTPENLRLEKNAHNQYYVILNGDLRIDNKISDGYTLTLDDNVSFNKIKVKNNTLNIDVGDFDRSIVVNTLDVQKGHINILGTGKLTIYVRNEMNMVSSSRINKNGSIEQLNIYLQGEKTIRLNSSQEIYGSLIAEKANIHINGGAGFKGHIITGGSSIKMNGGSWGNPTLFYAPNADFELSGGATVNGSIVAKSFDGSGGSIVTYKPITNLPIEAPNDSPSLDEILTIGPIKEMK